jgi:hypothetical protein
MEGHVSRPPPLVPIDYPALRLRLIDAPPDPFDDHPSLVPDEEEEEEPRQVVNEEEDLTECLRDVLNDRQARVFVFELRRELDEAWEIFRARVASYGRQMESLQEDAEGEAMGRRRRLSPSPHPPPSSVGGAGAGGAPKMEIEMRYLGRASLINAASSVPSPRGADQPLMNRKLYLKQRCVALNGCLQELVRHRIDNHRVCLKLIKALERKLKEEEGDGTFFSALLMWALSHPLFSDGTLASLCAGLERLYASMFTHGDMLVAHTLLGAKTHQVVHGADIKSRGLSFQLGAALVLAAWVLWDCLADGARGATVWREPALAIFRGLGNIVLLMWMWGANVWVWRRYGVDYRRCFRFGDSRVWKCKENLLENPCHATWRLACDLSVAWLAAFLVFYKAARGILLAPSYVPPQLVHASPLLLMIYCTYRVLTPWKRRGRPLCTALVRVVCAPLAPVGFLENYVGDVLTSTVRVGVDLAFSIVFFMSGAHGWLNGDLAALARDEVSGLGWFRFGIAPMIIAAPLWWRFQQTFRCAYDSGQRWPHLGNSLKYASALSLSVFGALRPGLHNSPLWIGSFIGATLYQFWWDICMDWSLVRLERTGGWLGFRLALREHRLYPGGAWPYMAAVVVNLILRFGWTVTILPEHVSEVFTPEVQMYLSPFVAAAEIFRRSLWGAFRVENEDVRLSERMGVLGDGLLDSKPFQRMQLGPGVQSQEGEPPSRKKLLWELVGWTVLLSIVLLAGSAS